MDKDSRGKEVYLGLATVRVSGRPHPRATNRNSLLPNSISASTTSMSQSTTNKALAITGHDGGGSETGDSLKSPLNEANNNNNALFLIEGTSGTSDGGGALNNGGIEVTKDSTTTKMKPTATVSCKKKRAHRRLGGGTTKNQDDGRIYCIKNY